MTTDVILLLAVMLFGFNLLMLIVLAILGYFLMCYKIKLTFSGYESQINEQLGKWNITLSAMQRNINSLNDTAGKFYNNLKDGGYQVDDEE